MTYCEQTDINEFAIHLTGKQLDALIEQIDGSKEPHLVSLLKTIRAEKLHLPKPGFERRRSIKLCHKCSGSGKIRIGDLRNMEYNNEDCPFCSGNGSIVEKTTISFECITPSVKNEFAR